MEPNDGKRFEVQWTEVIRHRAVLSEETLQDLGVKVEDVDGVPFMVTDDGLDKPLKDYLTHLADTGASTSETVGRQWRSDLALTLAPETEPVDLDDLDVVDAPRPE